MESSSVLRNTFYSQENVDSIQSKIRRRFRAETGMTIDRQSEQELRIIMGTVWENNSPSHVDTLNDIVADHCLEQIRVGVSHHLEWHRHKDEPHLMVRGQPGDKWNPLVLDENIF